MMPQKRVAAKSQELHQIVDELLTVVSDAVQQYTPIHEVESKALKILLRGGRRAVQLLVDCLGDGDVGEEWWRAEKHRQFRAGGRLHSRLVNGDGKGLTPFGTT